MLIFFMIVGLCLHINSMHHSYRFVSIFETFLNFLKIFISNVFWIFLGPYGYSDFFDRANGLLTPWSHVAHSLLPYGDDMSYMERMHNVILSVYDWWFRNWYMLPQQNEIAQRYFGHLAGMLQQFSNFLLNFTNLSFDFFRARKAFAKDWGFVPKYFVDPCQCSSQYIETKTFDARHYLLRRCAYQTAKTITNWFATVFRHSRAWSCPIFLGFAFTSVSFVAFFHWPNIILGFHCKKM